MSVQLLKGDCRVVLTGLPDCCVDAVVTDPPYELGFMGKQWDSSGVAYSVALWAEVLRVLKPGGHLLAFGGSRTYHRLACAVEDAGFEIRDQIMWVYGSGFPKSLDVSKAIDKAAPATDEARAWQGWGTALKPAHEPIVLARKPLAGTVAANVLAHGTGALNIDATRVEFASPEDRLESTTKNQHADFGTKPMTGNVAYGDFSMVKPKNYDPPGRWPANFVHDGSDEVLDLFPNAKGGQYPAARGQAVSTSFASGQATEGGRRAMGDDGSAARFFYCAKPSRAERNAGIDDLPERRPDERTEAGMGTFTEKGVAKQSNFHPTVKPIALMRWLIRLVTPPGGVVLDPFAGSGTTLVAAVMEHKNVVGIEMTEEYWPIIEGRVNHAEKLVGESLF